MAYYSRHSIFLYDNDKQKLLYLQTLIEEEELSFELREETVYQYDGEPLNMLCISDANYGPEIGCSWYWFDHDMERVSEKFNQKYPDDQIAVYVKPKTAYEILYEFHDGVSNYTDIIHFQPELNKVCEELNQKNAEVPVPLFEVIDIAHHPTVLFHFGAYTFIGYNVFELYSEDNRTYGAVASFGHSSRNYNHLPYRAKAQQILYDYLLEKRKAGKLRP
jgi:hypothetical protein